MRIVAEKMPEFKEIHQKLRSSGLRQNQSGSAIRQVLVAAPEIFQYLGQAGMESICTLPSDRPTFPVLT